MSLILIDDQSLGTGRTAKTAGAAHLFLDLYPQKAETIEKGEKRSQRAHPLTEGAGREDGEEEYAQQEGDFQDI